MGKNCKKWITHQEKTSRNEQKLTKIVKKKRFKIIES